MAVKYPTVDEVIEAFSNAIPISNPLDAQVWDKLIRGLMDPSFPEADRGISVLQSNEQRLVRIVWKFSIDVLVTSSDHNLYLQSADLRERLLTLVNGGPCSFDAIEFTEKTKGVGTEVTCWTRGIIG